MLSGPRGVKNGGAVATRSPAAPSAWSRSSVCRMQRTVQQDGVPAKCRVRVWGPAGGGVQRTTYKLCRQTVRTNTPWLWSPATRVAPPHVGF